MMSYFILLFYVIVTFTLAQIIAVVFFLTGPGYLVWQSQEQREMSICVKKNKQSCGWDIALEKKGEMR